MKTSNGKFFNFALLILVVLTFSCESQQSVVINENHLHGIWISNNLNESQKIVLAEGGIATLHNVFSVECGTYDKIQINNGAYSWHLSKVGNLIVIDIISNSENICLSFEVQKRKSLRLKPNYAFAFNESEVPIYFKTSE